MWPPAKRERANAAIEDLMREHGLARRFNHAVEREARRARERGLDVLGDVDARRDLTALATFTIDPASARDFDDAVSAERVSDTLIRVWVHIADVSAHVREGSPLDGEARLRATSVYVPGAVEPMLPEALSNDACSLVPGRERLAVTVELDLDGANVVRSSFYRSVVRSDARLEYEGVDRIFAGEEEAQEPWRDPLQAARAAAAALARAREQRGALVVESAEHEFAFDDEGNVSSISARAQTESHRLIEHLMIAANEAVASLLQRSRAPCLYRVHERPDPDRVERLVAQLASLEVPTPPVPEHLAPAQASELVGEISQTVDAFVRRSGRGRRAFGALVLRSLKQAYYSPRNIGHSGLRSNAYCHFTSPIRRYPDLVCHRSLLSVLGAGERAPRSHELVELGAWTSEREREAMQIERDGDDIALSFALEQALLETGWERGFDGEVVGMIAAGAFVAFGGPYEGMLPVRVLTTESGEREWWELNEEGTILRGARTGAALRLGDAIRVRVERVEAARGRVDLVRETQDSG
ncbi:MAG TPA: RNB domain-containing ribonuclease [Solirubrobacteraceae bacterium]|nr:RNB domain-containing ribonuclease [Solirubrobacteraceae bacterium]